MKRWFNLLLQHPVRTRLSLGRQAQISHSLVAPSKVVHDNAQTTVADVLDSSRSHQAGMNTTNVSLVAIPSCHIFERRETFRTAVNILMNMTPDNPPLRQRPGQYRQHTRFPTELVHDNRADQDKNDPHKVETSSFTSQIHKMTRSTPANSEVLAHRLQIMFDDPIYRQDLSLAAYTIAASYALRISNFRLLRHFMLHAQRNGVTADVNLCNTVLAIFVHRRDLRSWSAAAQEFAHVGMKADVNTWNQLLTLSSSEEKVVLIERLRVANIEGNSITEGIMLPLKRKSFRSTEAFLDSLDFSNWPPVLGDVLIGELLQTKDLRHILELFNNDQFSFTIQGIEQILSHMYSIRTNRFPHLRITKQVCSTLTRRGLVPRPLTWLRLFRLGAALKQSGYTDMIYHLAKEKKLINNDLWLARRSDLKRRKQKGFKPREKRKLTWDKWIGVSQLDLGSH